MDDTPATTERDEKRRAVLESLHLHEVFPGRLVDGMKQSDRVLVALFNSPSVAERFKHELAALGVKSWLFTDGLKTAVKVLYQDRTIAFERCARFRENEPDVMQRRRPFDFVIFGLVFGAVVGVVSLQFPSPAGFFAWFGFVATGGFVGYILDPGRRQRRHGVAGRFAIVDLFLLTTAVAALFAYVRFLLEMASQLRV